MRYYSFHIGDYLSHTMHLSEIEDLAYRRMIDVYYLHEKPLPNSVKKIAKMIRMDSQTEAVATILHAFFYPNFDPKCDLTDPIMHPVGETFGNLDASSHPNLAKLLPIKAPYAKIDYANKPKNAKSFANFEPTDTQTLCWRHPKIDQDIAKFRAKSAKAQRSALVRWQNKSLNKKDIMRTHSERIANASSKCERDAYPTKLCERNANQEPIKTLSKEKKPPPSEEVKKKKSFQNDDNLLKINDIMHKDSKLDFASDQNKPLKKKDIMRTHSERISKIFSPPTINSIYEYILGRIDHADEVAEKFFHHHDSNDWILKTGQPMKSWKKAVLEWLKNERRFSHQNFRKSGDHIPGKSEGGSLVKRLTDRSWAEGLVDGIQDEDKLPF